MKRTLLLSAAVMIALASCKKNDSGYTADPGTGNNSTAGSQMSYQLTAMNRSNSVAQKTTAGNITWTTGLANPTLVKFEARQSNTEIEYKSTNNATIDLMAPAPIDFGTFAIPNGTYDEIELKIDLNNSGSTPALQLAGQFTSGAVSIPVQLIINEDIELKTEQENVTVTDNTAFIALTTLDLSLATIDIKESMLLSGNLTNGVLVISNKANKDIYNRVLDNLRKGKHHCHFEHHHK